MRFTTLNDWLRWQETLHPRTIELGLERVRTVLRRLRPNAPPFAVVTVGGTNGKGSSVAFLDAILRAAGHRVGAYVSPHLLRYNERIQVDGAEADDESLCRMFARIDAVRGDVSLTYFEFGTLAALEWFWETGVDVAVLEVGLGGRLDAVNAVDADAALVTSVALDHTDWLGPDRDSIGHEKAGIYRPGRPAVCADPDPPPRLLEHARAIGARLLRVGSDYDFSHAGEIWRWRSDAAWLDDLPLPALAGEHQLGNAAAALMVLTSLSDRLPVDAVAIRAGLTRARLPGRFQIVPGPVEWILDVAHNPAAAAVLANQLKNRTCAGRTWAIMGLLADKDADGVIEALAGVVDEWRPVTLTGARAGGGRPGCSPALGWSSDGRPSRRHRGGLPSRARGGRHRRPRRRAGLVPSGRSRAGRPAMDSRFLVAALTGDLLLDNRLTQRLVGVAVIMALAVVFVPRMLQKQEHASVAPVVAPPPVVQPPTSSPPPTLTFSQPPPSLSPSVSAPTSKGWSETGESPAMVEPARPAPAPPAMVEPARPAPSPAVAPASRPKSALPPTPPVVSTPPPIEAAKTVAGEAARRQAAQEAAANKARAEAERGAAARARAEARQKTAQAEAAKTRAKMEAERSAAAKAEVARLEATQDEATSPYQSSPAEALAAQAESRRAAEAARRESARAEAARKSAQEEAVRKAALAEAARAEAARRRAQVEATGASDARARSEPPRTEDARTRSPAALPNIELVAKSEALSATARPSAPPAGASTPSQPAPASVGGAVVGNYALRENANALRDYYRSQKIRAVVEEVMTSGRTMYRVRIWR